MTKEIESKLDSVRDSVDLQHDKIDSIADFLFKEVKKINKSLNKIQNKFKEGKYGLERNRKK